MTAITNIDEVNFGDTYRDTITGVTGVCIGKSTFFRASPDVHLDTEPGNDESMMVFVAPQRLETV